MWYVFTLDTTDKSCWYRNISIEADTEEKAVKTYKRVSKEKSVTL